MTIQEFKSRVQQYRTLFDHHSATNVESIRRVQYLIDGIIEFLNSVNADKELSKRIKTAIQHLQAAHANAETFGQGMQVDRRTHSDTAVTHPDEMFWYRQVIGTAESALDQLLR